MSAEQDDHEEALSSDANERSLGDKLNQFPSSLASAANRAGTQISKTVADMQEALKDRVAQGSDAIQEASSSSAIRIPHPTRLLSATFRGASPQPSQSSQAEDQTWRRRIAGLSAHLKLPFQNSSHAGLQGFAVSTEVETALRDSHPVVALESTIISHGMPYPDNLATAQAVESVVRENGAVPATIAIIEGRPHIGLTSELLKRIAQSGRKTMKTSRRDIPYVIAKALEGATTVSATMLLASRAGISVFVTGGIGGVHRGGESSMDVSSDLTEFSKSPIAVVCAGAKSILDIPRTLEYLETQGVPVAAYQTDEFPAFFTSHSGCKAPARVDSPDEAADLIQASKQLGLGSGVLIGVPIPPDQAAEGGQIENAIHQSLKEAREKSLSGAETTPFLLERIQELTQGKSLTANIGLIKHNAAVGAKIAVALSQRSNK